MTCQFRELRQALALVALFCAYAFSCKADVDKAIDTSVLRILALTSNDHLTTGTGFVVDDGLLVTNHHVIRDSTYVQVLRRGQNNTNVMQEASVEDVDEVRDLALLKVDNLRAKPLPFRYEQARHGDHVVSLGFPSGADTADSDPNDAKLIAVSRTDGRISLSVERSWRSDLPEVTMVLHTAPIQQGASGGPVLDACGGVVGVNTAFVAKGNGDQTVYAIDGMEVRRWLKSKQVNYELTTTLCDAKRSSPKA